MAKMTARLLAFVLLCVAPALRAQQGVENDIKMGREAAAEIERTVGLVNLPAAETLVKKVGERLVESLDTNPYTFTFSIVDQEEPNAFALPGGFVYVSRGLIVLLKNEDELAGVLGHEISHVTFRHSASRQKKAILPAILALPGAIASESVASMTGVTVKGPIMGAARAYLASYSRGQESEADDHGIRLAAKAGYQPRSLSEILNRLESYVEAQTGEASKYNLFSDHPMTPERMKAIETLVPTLAYSPRDPVVSRSEFLPSFDGVGFGPNPANGVFHQQTFLHPGLMVHWDLPEGWEQFNQESAAGAYTSDQKNMIALRLAGLDRQKDTLIERFVNRYYAKTRKKPISDKDIDLITGRGSEVILPGAKKNEILYTLWVKNDGYTYLILGSGPSEQTELLRKSGMTFGDLTASDKPHVSRYQMLTTTANKDEGVDAITKRTGNVLKPDWLALINELPSGQNPDPGTPVKVIVRKPYFEN